MQSNKKDKHVEGGKPTTMNRSNSEKHEDDTDMPLRKNLKEAAEKAEKDNQNNKKGYNEKPPEKSTEE
ncbi:hypothetical protein CLV98_104199 [Dyadobacter jejuensis]|uniref:Uncharacterized protein n=1 Tax=Dyadobacter jejuensis TaxID=1082580 RepID=A0A316ANH9_9BACT|nr:hypothetical protein [Dyadobacter jejuensis]PWJ58340.1 hypothetical protein CLV98_104199 [Dyadobacter jejuensis]